MDEEILCDDGDMWATRRGDTFNMSKRYLTYQLHSAMALGFIVGLAVAGVGFFLAMLY